MPCHMAPPIYSPAPFLYCFHRIETAPAFERMVICHFERTGSYRNIRHLLSRKTRMKLQIGESDGLIPDNEDCPMRILRVTERRKAGCAMPKPIWDRSPEIGRSAGICDDNENPGNIAVSYLVHSTGRFGYREPLNTVLLSTFTIFRQYRHTEQKIRRYHGIQHSFSAALILRFLLISVLRMRV